MCVSARVRTRTFSFSISRTTISAKLHSRLALSASNVRGFVSMQHLHTRGSGPGPERQTTAHGPWVGGVHRGYNTSSAPQSTVLVAAQSLPARPRLMPNAWRPWGAGA